MPQGSLWSPQHVPLLLLQKCFTISVFQRKKVFRKSKPNKLNSVFHIQQSTYFSRLRDFARIEVNIHITWCQLPEGSSNIFLAIFRPLLHLVLIYEDNALLQRQSLYTLHFMWEIISLCHTCHLKSSFFFYKNKIRRINKLNRSPFLC